VWNIPTRVFRPAPYILWMQIILPQKLRGWTLSFSIFLSMTAGKPEEVVEQAKLSRKRRTFSAIEQITEVSGDGYTAMPKGLNLKLGGEMTVLVCF